MKKRGKQGQASIEYLMVVGIVLIIVFVLFYFVFFKSSENIKLVQAEDFVTSLVQGADEVYSLAPGTKKTIWVNLPGGVQSAIIYPNEISLTISVSGGTSDIVAISRAPLVGTLPSGKGTHRISVEHLPNGVVLVGSGNDTVAPVIVWTNPSGLSCNPITLRANTNEPATCKYSTTDQDYSNMETKMVGTAIGHSYSLGVQQAGNYTYYLRCQDSFNNEMQTSTVIGYNIDFTYCSGQGEINETTPPIVTLVNPDDGTTSNNSRNLFFYTVQDDSSILVCNLLTNDGNGEVLTAIQNLPLRNIENNITGDLDAGNYTWKVSCIDIAGNSGNSSLRNIEITAVLDADNPIVNLIAPANQSLRNFNLVKFFYNVTDQTSEINSCTLAISGILDTGSGFSIGVTDSSIIENQQEIISLTLEKGNYSWNVSCIDDSIYANQGTSETRTLIINSTTDESFITSCAGQCGWDGFSDGICRQSQPKCAQEGETYSADGSIFCTGGSQSDTCCCVP
jgi:hypothetical protein